MKITTSRRELLGGVAAAFAGANASFAAPVANDEAGFKLGVASYSLRKLSRADAIKGLETLKVRYVNIKDFHASLKSTPEELAQARKDFENAGLQILGVGNINFAKNDEGEMRRNFEYAKTLGAPLIVMAPTRETLPGIEKLVKEYNIKAAIHNHGPEDKHFPGPSDVLKAIKGMDQRVGLCIDIGHTARANEDIVQSIKDAGPRLHDMHVKDLANATDKKSQVAVGEGVLPIAAMFRQLQRMGYKGGVMLEYEINETNPVPGMQLSFAYMRGVLAGMKA
jgi:sugar phosphate isomerase/epimerase